MSEIQTEIAVPTPDFHERVRKGMRVLSYSQISTFLSCRHRWYLQYYLGLHTLRPPDPLVLGDAVHQALAEYWLNGTDPAVFIQDFITKHIGTPSTGPRKSTSFHFDTLIDSADELGTNALHATRAGIERIEREGWVPYEIITPSTIPVKAVELELRTSLPFAPAFDYFASHIDLIALHPPSNRVWLLDYKVRKQFASSVFEDVNLQAMIYATMAQIHGIPITGTGTLEIRAIPPERPTLNQNGTMSRVRIATTWEVYRRTLLDHWLDPADYEEMRQKLNTPWTRLTQEFRPDYALDKVWDKVIVPTATLMSDIMLDLDEDISSVRHEIHRNLGPWQCNSCGVRPVCLAGLYDRDILHAVGERDGNKPRIKLAIEKGAF